MAKDLLEYFNDEDAKQIALDLVAHLEPFKQYAKVKGQKDKEAIGRMDYSYDLSDGKVQGKNSNTWFDFDLKEGKIAFEFMKAMYAREISEDEENKLNEFMGKVATELHNSYLSGVRDVVRNSVLPDSDPKIIPLEQIEILGIEIVDYSSVDEMDKHTMRYIKLPDIPVNMQAINSRIMEVRDEKPGITVADIIHQERLAANPLFDALMGVDLGEKYLWSVRIAMWVDYSFSQEFLDEQKFAGKKD